MTLNFIDLTSKDVIFRRALDHNFIMDSIVSKIEPVDFISRIHGAEKVKSLREKYMKAKKEGDVREAEKYNKALAELEPKEHQLIIESVKDVMMVADSINFSFAKQVDSLYYYNGAYWKEFEQEELTSFLKDCALKQGISIYKAEYYKFIAELKKQFFVEVSRRQELPKDVVLVNMLNGTLEIQESGELTLREFRKDDFLKYQLQYKFEPNATCPKWDKFLSEVLSPNLIPILAEHIGYALVPFSVLTLQRSLFQLGTGSNGKSVVFEIVNKLLGEENVSNYSLKSLTDDTGYTRAKIANKLLNYCSEVGASLQTEHFKQLVAGEGIEARLPYKDPLIIKNYAKLMFNCNSLPKEVEHSHAYFRRIDIIPYEVTIPVEKQDPDLVKKISENELPGIFNWALEGMQRILKARAFTPCKEVDEARQKYKDESNTVKMFMNEEGWMIEEKASFPFTDFYKEYCNYCTASNYRILNKKNFKDRVLNEGAIVDRKAGGYYINVIKESVIFG
jgi:putative DNA primase/helicase